MKHIVLWAHCIAFSLLVGRALRRIVENYHQGLDWLEYGLCMTSFLTLIALCAYFLPK